MSMLSLCVYYDLYAPIQFGDDCTHGKGKLMRLLAAVHASKHCQLQ